MAMYVKLTRERRSNGRVSRPGDMVHVPNCVGWAMARNGQGYRIKEREARKILAEREAATAARREAQLDAMSADMKAAEAAAAKAAKKSAGK